jgi:hypothetical protein
MNNGRPPTKDWLGGGANLHQDVALLHEGPEAFLTMLVLDGVLERHPTLRGAAVELGAGWVPELLRRLDWVVKHWSRNDENLQRLRRTPSEQITQQLAFTPFVFEEVGPSSTSRTRTSTCSPRTIRTSRAAGTRSAASRRRWASGRPSVRDKFYAENFRRIFADA